MLFSLTYKSSASLPGSELGLSLGKRLEPFPICWFEEMNQESAMDLSVGSGLSKIKMSLMTVTDGMAYI